MSVTSVENFCQTLKFRSREFYLSGKPLIMGILNVTPDSFSDGGKYVEVDQAITRGTQMIEQGADIIDIGGESSRPGSRPVSEEEELSRVLPVITTLSHMSDLPLSIDTTKAAVAKAALQGGAQMVNDMSGLEDPHMVDVLKNAQCPFVINHIRGVPETMQFQPFYDDVIAEVYDYFATKIEYAISWGCARENIILDVGLGFGKRLDDNLSLLASLDKFREFGSPLLIGASKKSFIGEILGVPVEQRLCGSLAVAAYAILKGVSIVRVHDVLETYQVSQMLRAIPNRDDRTV